MNHVRDSSREPSTPDSRTPEPRKPFVVISGLPGSGKTTLGRRVALALNLPLIDKDDILDRLFDAKGTGDAARRRTLSRESDAILQSDAMRAAGAVLVSFRHLQGMAPDSGTPVAWLHGPSRQVVHLHCTCDVTVAARRFLQRRRHAGHLDHTVSESDVLTSFRQLALLPVLEIGPRLVVDTSGDVDVAAVVRDIRDALGVQTS